MTLWAIAGGILLVIVWLQTSAGKYGEESAAAWNWFLGLVTAPVSVLGAAAFGDPKANWGTANAHAFKFRFAFLASLLLLIAAIALLVVEPASETSAFDLFAASGIPLTLWQGFVVAAIGAVVFDRR